MLSAVCRHPVLSYRTAGHRLVPRFIAGGLTAGGLTAGGLTTRGLTAREQTTGPLRALSSMSPPKDTSVILTSLRAAMKDRRYVSEPLAAYIVPSCDAHNSEYLAQVLHQHRHMHHMLHHMHLVNPVKPVVPV